jgi:hypothetical protein
MCSKMATILSATPTPRTSQHYVYFMQGRDTKRVKIGYAAGCPKQRMRDLQGGCTEILEIIGLINLGECSRKEANYRERQIQIVFADLHAYGEIFNYSDFLIRFIAEYSYPNHSCPRCPLAELPAAPWVQGAANRGRVWIHGKLLQPAEKPKPTLNPNRPRLRLMG